MYTVLPTGQTGYFVRSPGGRVVDSFSFNTSIPGSVGLALKSATDLCDRMNKVASEREAKVA